MAKQKSERSGKPSRLLRIGFVDALKGRFHTPLVFRFLHKTDNLAIDKPVFFCYTVQAIR